MITGFPQTAEQAVRFEATFGEIHGIIEVDTSLEAIQERMQKAGLQDEAIEQKVNDYKAAISPLLDFYRALGKVRTVDGNRSPPEVYREFVEASLPQLFFFIGPRCSGKSTVCKHLAKRTNMHYIDFKTLLSKKRFAAVRGDPEAVTKEFIRCLHTVKASRLIIEGFPENSKQLLCFLLNAIKPRGCVFLKASESSCLTFSTKGGTKCDVSSAVLCRLIKDFYAAAKEMVEILKKHECLIELINGEEIPLERVLENAARKFDPEVLLMRCDEDGKESMGEAVKKLNESLQYRVISVHQLRRIEVMRNTPLAKEMIEHVIEGKFIAEEATIRLLKAYLYPVDGHCRFLLLDFSGEVAHLQQLESQCCNLAKEFYFYPQQGEIVVHPAVPTVETYMHRSNRVVTLTQFEEQNMERYYGEQLVYAMVMGAPLSGKTTVARMVEKCGFTLLDALVLAEDIKRKLATEDNPAESITVSLDQLIEELKLRVARREKFVLDGFSLEDGTATERVLDALGAPAFFVELVCGNEVLKERYKKKNEVAELSEEQTAELEKAFAVYSEILKSLQPLKEEPFTTVLEINSEAAEESTLQEVKGIFEPGLILITHDEVIDTDCILTNLSIKYNFLYVPLAPAIKAEIQSNTKIGRELKRTRKFRSTAEKLEDWEYCPVHYEAKMLVALVKDTIKRLRVEQKFVLVDGLLNTARLKEEEDKMQLRAIDELLGIEKEIGEIKAILRLSYDDYENVTDDRVAVKQVVEEKKEVQEEVKEEAKKEEDEEPPPPPAEEEDKQEKPAFKAEDYAWTDTEGKPRNIGQFFSAWKKCACKNIFFNGIHSGINNEILLDSLISSIISGQLSKTKTYTQVRFAI